MTEITSLTITELKSGLAARQFSATEVATAFLSRIAKNGDLNAFTEVLGDSALAEAANCDQLIGKDPGKAGALCGVPLALKDIILLRGVKNTCGSKMLSNFVAPYDATVTAKLKSAGAIFLGKTNMDEFAMGSSNETSAFGCVRNPWDRSRVPGGSSGGSAAAVAANMAPGALGTDTGGSIRQPSAFCSTVGIKPTYGRVSRYGVVAFASSLDQVGPIARSVRDCAILTAAISGHDPHDATSMDLKVPDFEGAAAQASQSPELKGLRIGVPKEYFIAGLNAEVEASVRKGLAHLQSLGAELVEITLPHTEAAVAVYYIIAPAEASSNLARFDGIRYGHRASGALKLEDLYARSRSEGFGWEVKRRILIGTYVLSSGYIEAYYHRAQKVRTLIKRDFENAFANSCDVIACPTAPTTAFSIGEKTTDPLAMYLNDVFTIPVNLAGLPAMSLPCGFDKTGLPIGMQLIGKPWDEAGLFKVGAAFEATTEWHSHKPKGI